MRSSEIKMFLIVILIGIVIIGGLLIWRNNKNKGEVSNTNIVVNDEKELEEYVQKLENGSKLNVSSKLLEPKNFDGLQISNIQLKETGGITTLLADVENKTSSSTNSKSIKIDILDKQGNVITTFTGLIEEMQVGEKVQLNASVTAGIANAYDFRIRN